MALCILTMKNDHDVVDNTDTLMLTFWFITEKGHVCARSAGTNVSCQWLLIVEYCHNNQWWNLTTIGHSVPRPTPAVMVIILPGHYFRTGSYQQRFWCTKVADRNLSYWQFMTPWRYSHRWYLPNEIVRVGTSISYRVKKLYSTSPIIEFHCGYGYDSWLENEGEPWMCGRPPRQPDRGEDQAKPFHT